MCRTTVNIMFLVLLILSPALYGDEPCELIIDRKVYHNQNLNMIMKEGPGKYDNALALNVQYSPIEKSRKVVSKSIGQKLDFFRAWSPSGEAHVTVITPVEYFDILKGSDGKPLISMQDIANIANKNKIQKSDLAILGIGKGQAQFEGKIEETFFVIVESMNLRKIRQEIYDLYILRGGNPKQWNPQRYFPHITIGYTKRDLHESDGVYKSMEYSYDSRFDVHVP